MPLAMMRLKCVWMLAKPGITTLPAASTVSAPGKRATIPADGPTAAILPSSIATAAS
jgi:hypothetical protein